jgi:hypothetical protein
MAPRFLPFYVSILLLPKEKKIEKGTKNLILIDLMGVTVFGVKLGIPDVSISIATIPFTVLQLAHEPELP